ncbi:MAG TPA: TrmH family RNA methyltransferase [Candidatus Saccharimonadales bacterium]
MSEIVLIAHNLRSCHNVGSLLRTAEGLGVHKVYLTGYTPYPVHACDVRLPHLSSKIHKQIAKTALGAEETQVWEQSDELTPVLEKLKADGYTIAAIEQASNSTALPSYAAPDKIALLVGREVEGVEPEVLARMNVILEIPMFGKKESFNVVQAAAMGMYHCAFY